MSATLTSPTPKEENQLLEPLMMLVGSWHGEGKGPYGPYEFESEVEVRGRWLLLTMTVFEPKTDKISYVSTQVFGYENVEMTLDLFDTAGSFTFHGCLDKEALTFNWSQDENWKRSKYWPVDDGQIAFSYESLEGTISKDVQKFEGMWIPGKRSSSQ